jgi:hypothetical protein
VWLRLSDWVMVACVSTPVAEHLEARRFVDGQQTAVTMGRGRHAQPLVPGWIVVSAAASQFFIVRTPRTVYMFPCRHGTAV